MFNSLDEVHQLCHGADRNRGLGAEAAELVGGDLKLQLTVAPRLVDSIEV